jgi:hypothetical protein
MPDEKVVLMPKPKEHPARRVLTFHVGGRGYGLRLPNTAKTIGRVIPMPSASSVNRAHGPALPRSQDLNRVPLHETERDAQNVKRAILQMFDQHR